MFTVLLSVLSWATSPWAILSLPPSLTKRTLPDAKKLRTDERAGLVDLVRGPRGSHAAKGQGVQEVERGGGYEGRHRRAQLRGAEGHVAVLEEAIEGGGDNQRDTDVQGPVHGERLGAVLPHVKKHWGVSKNKNFHVFFCGLQYFTRNSRKVHKTCALKLN